jgi:cellulose synthase/poly-beta-1,6-N-acetylglucosamine synthase-like glycosyltransferase
MHVFFFILAGVSLATLLHPFVFYPFSLRLLWRRHRQTIRSRVRAPKRFALCVCAFNEEAVIRHKAENCLALKRALPGLEILIYVDAATDRTAQILADYRDEIKIYAAPARRGKTHGMNFLVAQTAAEIVVFSDANVTIDPAGITALGRYFADPEVGCVCGHLKYLHTATSVTAANGSLYWRLEEHIKQLESDTGSTMGADGSLFAVRHSLHRPPPDDTIDDMYVSLSILCDGYRVVRTPEIVAYEE